MPHRHQTSVYRRANVETDDHTHAHIHTLGLLRVNNQPHVLGLSKEPVKNALHRKGCPVFQPVTFLLNHLTPDIYK